MHKSERTATRRAGGSVERFLWMREWRGTAGPAESSQRFRWPANRGTPNMRPCAGLTSAAPREPHMHSRPRVVGGTELPRTALQLDGARRARHSSIMSVCGRRLHVAKRRLGEQAPSTSAELLRIGPGARVALIDAATVARNRGAEDKASSK